ncbi:hypothetical protein NBM05_06780 [Rothia sp. AR01]|uniref:NADH:quinone oxidoreductase/Mrp antiporter transmembrane domain-containing protein n=1 Tax=Rothia santali TaxID=2949643 RepID=A0A9X2KI77_9MICC|nr:proton-conducting transporter membrane subunit [Rothia santali]MCP3425725.1 hypothetical protein [Rothia santali]
MSAAETAMGGAVLLPLLAAALLALLPAARRRAVGCGAAVATAGLVLLTVREVSAGRTVEVALGGHRAPLGIALYADGLSALFLAMTAVVGLVVCGYAALVPASTGMRAVAVRDRARATAAAVGRGNPAAGPASRRVRRVRIAPRVPSVRIPEWRGGSGVPGESGEPGGRVRWTASNPGFWPLWLACWAGLNAVFVSGDLFNTYVGLELVGLSAVGLVALGGRGAWEAALRYLFIAVAGSILFLIAAGLIVAATGTLDLRLAAEVVAADQRTHGTALLALVLLTLGLCLKLALMPLHAWLVPAHAGSPSAVSPLMSALVIKASLFVLLRCWIWLVGSGFGDTIGPAAQVAGTDQAAATWLGWVLGALGTLALLAGGLLALRQTRLKPLIAYSTVAQVGYWFLLFPILVDPASATLEDRAVTTLAEASVVPAAIGGAVALALGHGLAKAALFLAAGFLKDRYGTDEIEALHGAGRRHPALVMAIGLATVGLVGLPLSLGFAGKWQLATAAVASGHYWMLAVLVAATLLTAAYLLKVLAALLMDADDSISDLVAAPRGADGGAGGGAGGAADGTAGEGANSGADDGTDGADVATADDAVPAAAQLAPLALGVLTVLTGLAGVWTADLLEVGAPW